MIKLKPSMDKKRPFLYEVFVYYQYSDKEVGETISRHYTYQAAEAKARQSSMWGIREINRD